MIFEFVATGRTGFMAAFAERIGSKIKNGLIVLPASLGKGYIKALDLDPQIRMMVHEYELKEDLTFRRIAATKNKDVVTMTFHNIFQKNNHQKNNHSSSLHNARFLPSVQITSTDLNFETFFPANTKINTIIISIHVDVLKSMLTPKESNAILETIISGSQAYVYEELISPQIKKVAAEIVEVIGPQELQSFYYKLKAQELIYTLFVELLKRQDTVSHPLNTKDVKMMYAIRDKILGKLQVQPNLASLAAFSGMSESKMKRLFKQIFGNSIYSYYQSFRMNEAAYLIKEQSLSVSEAGYRLGFSNLSHFARLFEKHMGLKPKKFSLK